RNLFAGRTDRPPVILWSIGERLNVLDHYAFCALGGAGVATKGLHWHVRCERIWDAIFERAWRPPAHPPAIALDDRPWQRDILPALEHGFGYEQTTEWLSKQPIRPRARSGADSIDTVRRAVNVATSALGQNPQLLEHVRVLEPDWPGLD